METKNVKLSSVKLNKQNPRTITADKVSKLVNSILVFPKMLNIRPVVVDNDMIVLGGNMRIKALQKIKSMKIGGIVEQLAMQHDYVSMAEEERSQIIAYWTDWLQSPCVDIVDASTLTEQEKKQFIIKDNVSFGAWDYDMLANEWDAISLSEWGVDAWAEEDKDQPAPNVEEDDFDEEKDVVVCRCKRGDIWQLGEHRVMCGDSTSHQDVETLLGGVKADMVFTDPPYGVSIGDKNAALNSVQPSGRCTTNIKNDTLSAEELYPILVKAMTNARLSCKDDASYYVTSPQGGELGMMMMMMKDAELPVRHILIWRKNSATFSLGRLDYDYQHEPIFYTWTKKHHNYRNGKYRTTIWDFDKPRKCDLHPTMKPVGLVANAMLDGTKEGDVVLDIFGGSGTTLIAAEQLQRKAYLMELDAHYCDVIIARWEKETGLTAIKIN